jgi:MoaA/NifB/PqqE/SkfB family radical SAM enzyme
VLVAARDEALQVPALLTALAGQAGVDARPRLVLVDDGSVDGSADLARRLLADWPEATVLVQPPAGKLAALAAGLRHVLERAGAEDLVLFTDADCRPAAGWLAAHLAAHAAGADLVGGHVVLASPDGEVSAFRRFENAASSLQAAVGFMLGRPPFARGANWSTRARLLRQVDGLSNLEDLPSGDDVHLIRRLGQVAARCAFLTSAASIVHTREAGNAVRQARRRYGKLRDLPAREILRQASLFLALLLQGALLARWAVAGSPLVLLPATLLPALALAARRMLAEGLALLGEGELVPRAGRLSLLLVLHALRHSLVGGLRGYQWRQGAPSRESLLFLRHTLTLRRLWNAVKSHASYGLSLLLRRPIVWGLPTVFMVEPTNACNLKCPLCPTGAGTLKRPARFLDKAVYDRLLDELGRDAFMVLLWNQGESFLHPDFLPMVRRAAGMGLWTYASTNGHYLDDPDALVRSGLGTLLVSVDGASAETYEAYRRSGNFPLVVEGLTRLMAAKRRLGSATPVVHLQFIVMRHNQHEILEIDRLARRCGVDRLTLKTVQIYDDADIDVWLPEDEAARRYQVVEDEGGRHFAMKHGYPNRCQRLWNQPVLNAGGELAVCCFDKDSDFAMGDLSTHNFRELWTSRPYMAFRRAVFRQRSQFEMCRNCGEGVRLTLEQRDLAVDLRRPLGDSLRHRGWAVPDEDEVRRRIEAARASRPREAGGREQRREGRDGVAGMSLGQGPRPIEELEGREAP